MSDYWLMSEGNAMDYSVVIPVPNPDTQEPVMARYLHIAFGALLLSLAGASTYVLCSETMLNQASIYVLR